jgi:hypothetical protein
MRVPLIREALVKLSKLNALSRFSLLPPQTEMRHNIPLSHLSSFRQLSNFK